MKGGASEDRDGRGPSFLASRLLACFLLAFWAAFLLLPLAGLGGAHTGWAGTLALGLAAVAVPLGYLLLDAGRRRWAPPARPSDGSAKSPSSGGPRGEVRRGGGG